jgi:hypothetical protein
MHSNLKLIEKIIRENAPKAITDKLMQKFEDEIIPFEDADDPARPSLCKDEFRTFLEETISENLSVTITTGGSDIKIGIGDANKLGMSAELDENTTDCIKIIGTILSGIAGNYVLVTLDMNEGDPEGRFGKAFLVAENQYRLEAPSKGWDPNKPRWKFSNFPGVPDFFEVDLGDFVESVTKKFGEALKSK